MLTWIGLWALIWWDGLRLPLQKNNKFKASSEIRKLNKSIFSWIVSFSGSCCLTLLASLAFSGKDAINFFNFLILLFFYRLWYNKLLFPWKLPVGQAPGKKSSAFELTAEQEEEREETGSSCPICTTAKSLSCRQSETLPMVDCGIDKQITKVLSNLVVRKIWNSRRVFLSFDLLYFWKCSFSNTQSMQSNTEDIQQFNWVMWHTMKAALVITSKPGFYSIRLSSLQLREPRQCSDAQSLINQQ